MCSNNVHYVTTHISHLKTILITKFVQLKNLYIIFTVCELLHISEI